MSSQLFAPVHALARRSLLTAVSFMILFSTGCIYDLNRSNEVQPGEIKGRAIRPDGTAAAFADINLEGSPLHTTAQADGQFSLQNVPEGTHRLFLREDSDGDGWPERAKVLGFRIVNVAKATGVVGVGAEELSGVNFGAVTLDGVVRLSGSVVDEDDAAVAGARVVVIHDEVGIEGVVNEVVATNGDIEARAGTDANGAFVVPGIAAGAFTTFAFGQREGTLLLSDTRTITRQEGEERLEGDNALVVRPTNAPPRPLGFTLLPSPAPGAEVTVTLEAAGGIAAETLTRTATQTEDGYTVDAIPVGPWALSFRSGQLRSDLVTRFVLPGDGLFSIGRVALGNQGCTNCDCDGDGIRGLPVLEDNHVCAADSIGEGEAIWDACAPQCAPRNGRLPRVCNVEGRVFDCEDDRDGQADPAEQACYGLGKGTDCDGDDLCAFEDDDDRCPRGESCDAQSVANVCATTDLPPAPVDGGPQDAGFDAGEVDAGEVDAGVDAGVTDAGFDGGAIDGGFDAGVLIDAGFDAGVLDGGFDAGEIDAGFDAGVIDAGVVDAGFDVPPIDAGPPIPQGFAVPTVEGWTAVEMKEIYFGKTAALFQFGLDSIVDCPVRRAAAISPTYLLAVFDTDGACLYQLIYDDIFNPPAFASGPDGGLYVSATVPFAPQNGEFIVGLDETESPVTVSAGQETVTIARLDGTGAVVEANAFDVNNGRLSRVLLATHPLGAGLALAGTLGPDDVDVAELILPSFAVARAPLSDGVLLLLSSDLSPTGLFELDADEDGGKAEVTGLLPLSPTSVGMVGVTTSELFSATPQSLAPSSAQTFLAEFVEGDAGEPPSVRWARRLAGTLPHGAFGPAFESGGFALAFGATNDRPLLVFGDTEQGVGRIEIDGSVEPAFSLGGLLATTRAFAYDANSNSFLTITENFQGTPTAFFIGKDFEFATEIPDVNSGDVANIVEVEVSNKGDLIFVVDNGLTAAVWADPIGPVAAYQIDTAVVGTDIAISNSGDVVYVDAAGDIVLHVLGDPPGTKVVLVDQIDAATMAIANGTLVFAAEDTLFTMPLVPSIVDTEVGLPVGIPVKDLAVDAATATAYVLIEGQGIRPYVLGSGILQAALTFTTEAQSVVVARPAPLALVEADGTRTAFGLPGSLQLTEIVDGNIARNASGGISSPGSATEVFPLSVGRSNGAFTVVGGVLGESVVFDRQGGGSLNISADDFDEQFGFEVEGFIGRFASVGDGLEAVFIDQTETADLNAFDEPPAFVAVDGSAGTILPLGSESRLADLVVDVGFGNNYLWRSPPSAAPNLGTLTVPATVNLRDVAGFDVNYASDVVLTSERVYIRVDLISRHYFPGGACDIDLSGGGFKAVTAVFAFDGDGNCVFGRGYLDQGNVQIAGHPDGGLLLALSADGSIEAFDTNVGNGTQVLSLPNGAFDVMRLDVDGFEVARLESVAASYSYGIPFALDDGGFGAAISHAGDLTVTYANATNDSAPASVGENVFVVAVEPDGLRRENYAYTSDVSVILSDVVALGANRVLVATEMFNSGTVNGVSSTGNDAHLSEFRFAPGELPPQTILEQTSTIDFGEVRGLARSPAGGQVAIRGRQSGGQAAFAFPAGNFPEEIPFVGEASFVALYDVGNQIREVIWEQDDGASIESAVINRYGHATLTIRGDDAGFTANFLRSPANYVGTFNTGEAGFDVLRIERDLSSGYRPTSSHQARTADALTHQVEALLATRGYVEEVFFVSSSDPNLSFDGAQLPGGANAAAPIWIPLALEGIAGR